MYRSFTLKVRSEYVAIGGLIISVLAIGPKVHGFKPGRGTGTFKGDTNPQHAFLQRGSEAVGYM
jgi:hypothetical protein